MLRYLVRSSRKAAQSLSTAVAPHAGPAGSPFAKLARSLGAVTAPLPPDYTVDPYLASLPPTEVSVIDNGLRVASEYIPDANEIATVGVHIDAGSRDDPASAVGTAHFCEHLFFKGTEKRSQEELERDIENMGAQFNAYTSRDHTVFYARCFRKDVPKALDLLSEVLFKSTFNADRVENERGVILRELQEVNSDMEELIFDCLHETAFQGTPLGNTILGPEDHIMTIQRDDLVNHVQKHYTAPRMVLVGAGAVSHDEMVDMGKQYFGSVSSQDNSAPAERPFFTGSDLRIRDDNAPYGYFAIGFESVSWDDPDSFALMVLQTLLGQYDRYVPETVNNSRLAQRFHEDNLGYKFMSFNTFYKDTGIFGAYAMGEPHQLNSACWAIQNEMCRLAYQAKEEELAIARNKLKTNLCFALDTTAGAFDDIGRQLLVYGRRVPLAEVFARVDAVDSSALKRAAQRVIVDKEISASAYGNIGKLQDLNKMRRNTYWLRY